MSLIDKAYFTLEELEERWRLPHRDLVYLAENGLLRLSVRLFGVGMEFGVYEEGADGEWFRGGAGPPPIHRVPGPAGARRVPPIPAGAGRRSAFHAPENEYCRADRADRKRFYLSATICWFAAKSAIGSRRSTISFARVSRAAVAATVE